jgi:hypothetical protein
VMRGEAGGVTCEDGMKTRRCWVVRDGEGDDERAARHACTWSRG